MRLACWVLDHPPASSAEMEQIILDEVHRRRAAEATPISGVLVSCHCGDKLRPLDIS